MISFFVGYLISFFRDRSKNKVIRSTVTKYINLIGDALRLDRNSLSAMEYNDRYTITFNKGELSKLGMVRLLKSEKKLVFSDGSFQLTDKEYDNLLEKIKPVL